MDAIMNTHSPVVIQPIRDTKIQIAQKKRANPFKAEYFPVIMTLIFKYYIYKAYSLLSNVIR